MNVPMSFLLTDHLLKIMHEQKKINISWLKLWYDEATLLSLAVEQMNVMETNFATIFSFVYKSLEKDCLLFKYKVLSR